MTKRGALASYYAPKLPSSLVFSPMGFVTREAFSTQGPLQAGLGPGLEGKKWVRKSHLHI